MRLEEKGSLYTGRVESTYEGVETVVGYMCLFAKLQLWHANTICTCKGNGDDLACQISKKNCNYK